jgi:hypothetical protein
MTADKSRIYLPEGIDGQIKRTVKNHVAEQHGGYTVLEGRGGWRSPAGETIEESVEVLEIVGMKAAVAESTADWVARHTSEDEVMWETLQVEAGFEEGKIDGESDILGQIEQEVTEIVD